MMPHFVIRSLISAQARFKCCLNMRVEYFDLFVKLSVYLLSEI